MRYELVRIGKKWKKRREEL